MPMILSLNNEIKYIIIVQVYRDISIDNDIDNIDSISHYICIKGAYLCYCCKAHNNLISTVAALACLFVIEALVFK